MSSALPSLETVIQAYDLRPKKSLGQNFLLDESLLASLVRYAGTLDGIHICEIGLGPGGLSRAILNAGAASLTAVEKDSRAVNAATLLKAHYGERFSVKEEDAMQLIASDHLPAPRAVIANLPYNIGTQLMLQWFKELEQSPDSYQFFLLMFQKEVAQRITAPYGSNQYGRLSVYSQWLCDVQICEDIPPEAFSPPPKVTSSLLHAAPKPLDKRLDVGNAHFFQTLLNTAFSQKRKMLRKTLKPYGENAIKALDSLNIDSTRRAETLSVGEFCALSKIMSS